MKIISILKRLVPIVILLAISYHLITYANEREAALMRGHEFFDAATAALERGELETAYTLYLQSAYVLEEPELQAIALNQAAMVGWVGELADYGILVGLYQQALRFNPELFTASFNLEYLFWLKNEAPDQLPDPALEEGAGLESSTGEIRDDGDV